MMRTAYVETYDYDRDALVSALQEMERGHPEKMVDRRDLPPQQ